MQRIDFENTTITKQPYVIIDGNEYEVQEGTYSGGTDLDADTFNILQDNIEDALSNVGGNEIAISETEPTTETTKLWIDTGEISQQASEITNSYSTSTGIGYSANYINNLATSLNYFTVTPITLSYSTSGSTAQIDYSSIGDYGQGIIVLQGLLSGGDSIYLSVIINYSTRFNAEIVSVRATNATPTSASLTNQNKTFTIPSSGTVPTGIGTVKGILIKVK